MKWLQQFYASQVKENIPRGYQSQVFMMRVMGVWPTADDSRWYRWLTIAFFLFCGFLYPFSLSINILFSNSIDEAMEHVFLSLTCWATTFKAVVIYWQRDNIRELFRIHEALLRGNKHNAAITDRVAWMNTRIHVFFTIFYLIGGTGFIIQSSFAEPKEALLPSVSRFPYDFAENSAIYWMVLSFQLFGNMVAVFWTSMEDTFYVALINTTCGHLAQLKENLKRLGTDLLDGHDQNLKFYKNVIGCCKCYEDCLR